MKKAIAILRAHKVLTVIAAAIVIGGGYYWYASAHGSTAVTKYVVEAASQGTVVSSVSASGQVQAVSSIPVKAQNSGNVTAIDVKVGEHVAVGQALVELDPTNEKKALAQAEINLRSSELSLEKLQEAPATATLAQTEDAVTQADQSLALASSTLASDYARGYDSLGSVFVDVQTVMTGLQNFITGKDLSKVQNDPDAFVSLLPFYLQAGAMPYRNGLQASFAAATQAYGQNLTDYHALSRTATPAQLDALFAETANTVNAVSDAVAQAKGLVTNIINNFPASSSTTPLPPLVNTYQNTFSNYIQTVTGDVTTMSNLQTSIASDHSSLTNGALSLKEKQDALAALQGGPDALDVQSQQLSIQNAQIAEQTAEQNLANDTVRAPVAGIVSAITAIVGTPAASSAVTIAADGEVAQVTLNEVDAAKVSLGDKATLTFDALPDLSVAGTVIEIDPVGTVSQGVVNYNVQVGFTNTGTSTQAVKPGMSVTANIVTAVRQDVVTVPNAAVVTQGGASYVLEPATPVASGSLASAASGAIPLPQGTKSVPVTVGITNNTVTEITSGVSVGDEIVAQTVRSGSSGSSAAGGTNALRALGGGGGAVFGGGGGGATRGGAAGATGR
ncbi:MAG TPA: efflux RND transporter periplasmic adaptor subunit [Candidatus Paceibacterota bacterium]|nr:efflux RND transporter periplasmic adaptor subunit [Candidatus Paceibacterota bacterium]